MTEDRQILKILMNNETRATKFEKRLANAERFIKGCKKKMQLDLMNNINTKCADEE